MGTQGGGGIGCQAIKLGIGKMGPFLDGWDFLMTDGWYATFPRSVQAEC